MSLVNIKKALILGAHLGLVAWILFTAFQTNSLSNEVLLTSYGASAIFAFFLFRNAAPAGNA